MIVGLPTVSAMAAQLAFIPHGHCYLWQPGLVWLHALSDGLIASAYLSISLGLAYFARRRLDLPYPWLFQLFGAFIVACGMTHAMEIWTLWFPTYWVSGALKAVTAGVSMVAAITLFPVIPLALNLPSRRELAAIALDLEQQVRDRTRSLQQSQERYKALLDSINGIVWELDIATFQVTFISQKAALILGYPVEAWCTQPNFWLSCFHPADRDTVLATYRHMVETGTAQDLEYRMITADGRVVWLWDQSKVLLEGDLPVKLQGIMVDITDRKATEDALAEANARFRNLTANIPGAVFRYLLRPDGSDSVLYMSPGCITLWEVDAAVVERDASILWQMIHLDDRPHMVQSVQQSAQTLQPWSAAWRITTPSGQEKWLEASGKPERQANGEVIWDTVILDVSDRKTAELAQRQSESRLQLALEASGEGLWDWDIPTGRFYLNTRYQQMLEYESGELDLNFERWQELIHPDDRPWVLERLHQHLANPAIYYAFDYRVRCRSGAWKWIANYGKVVAHNGQGQPTRMLGIHIDISDRKATEHALKVQRDFNQLIAEIASRFVNLHADEFDTEIERTLQLISELTHLDTSYLLMFNPDGTTMSMTHEWSQPGLPRQKAIAQNIPLSTFPWVMERVRQRQIVYVPNVAEMTDVAPVDQAAWQQFNLKAVLSVPLMKRTGVVGLIGFASFTEPMRWESETIRLLIVLGQTIANAQQQVQDEHQLAISEERLRLALAAANQGMYDLNVVTGEVIVSPEYALMLGYDPATFQETNAAWIERLHPDDRAPIAATYQAYVSGVLPDYKVEFRQRTRYGDYKWILSVGKVVEWSETGQPLRMLGTHTDISDRKRAETQLRDLTDRLQLALQAAKMGVWDWDIVNDRVRWDEQLCKLYGSATLVTNASFQTWADLVHPDDLAHTMSVVQTVLSSQTDGFLEFRVCLPDGRVRDIASYFLVERSAEGQPLHMIGMNMDISDRKRAETQLRDLTDRLQLALQAAKMGVWDWEIDRDRINWDERLYQLYGLPATLENPSYQTWLDIIHPDDLSQADQITQTTMAAGNEGFLEFRVCLPDGSYRHIASYFLVQRTPEGQPTRLVGVNMDISDRKRTETELRIQTELLQSTFDHLPVMVGVYSAQGEILIVNRQLEEIIGWSKEDYQSIDILHECYPDPAEYDRVLQHIIAADSTWQDFQTRLRDGRYLETSWAQIRLSDGRSIGIGQDISDRKRAETARLQAEKLRLELNLLEQILNNVLAGYWDSDYVRQTNYWSRGLKQMLGYADHELSNALETWQQLILPEDLPVALTAFQQHVQSRGAIPYYTEVRYQHKDGSIVWVICAGQVIRWSETGEPLRMVGCHVDITKLKQTEAQLQASEWSLREAQRIGKLGSWSFELATEQATWSDQVFRLFQRDPALGPPTSFEELQQLIHPSDRQFHAEIVQRTIATGEPYDIECCIARSDGTWGYMQARGEVIYDSAGQVAQLTGTVLDITERKHIEAQLRQTSVQLEASNRELEAFAYSVSHDLRAPLRAIDGFSKALLEDYAEQFDDEAQYYFDRIRYNIQRMGSLIEDLLNLSRVSRYEMQLNPVNLSQLVQEQLTELQRMDRDRIVEAIVAADVQVLADPTLMSVVVHNLLANAGKFTSHHSSARIEFGIIKQYEENVYFVRDDGAGFDMTYAAKLFGVF